MATSNIQHTGLENSIYFLEPSTYEDFGDDESFEGMSEEEVNEQLNDQFWDYVNEDLIDNMEVSEINISVFNHWEESEYCDK